MVYVRELFAAAKSAYPLDSAINFGAVASRYFVRSVTKFTWYKSIRVAPLDSQVVSKQLLTWMAHISVAASRRFS